MFQCEPVPQKDTVDTPNSVSAVLSVCLFTLSLAACSGSGNTEPRQDEETVIVVSNDNSGQVIQSNGGDAASQTISVTNGCLLASLPDNTRFCFLESSRTLSAFNPDDSIRWSFALPGDNATNTIRSLLIVESQLVIVAELDAGSQPRKFELSGFDFSGAFNSTIAIEDFRFAGETLGQSDQAISIVAAGVGLLFVTDYVDDIGSGVLVARVDSTNGLVTAKRRFPGEQLQEVRTGGGSLIISMTLGTRTLDTLFLQDSNGSVVTSNSFYSMDERSELRDRFLSMLSDPPIAGLISREQQLRSGNVEEIDGQLGTWCEDAGFYRMNTVNRFLEEGTFKDFIGCEQDNVVFNGVFEETIRFHRSQQVLVSGESSVQGFRNINVVDNTTGDTWSGSFSIELGSRTVQNSSNEASITSAVGRTSVELAQFTGVNTSFTMNAVNYLFDEVVSNQKADYQWEGNTVLSNNNSGVTETVDTNLTREIDEDGVEVLSGRISAVAVGGAIESLTIEVAGENSDQLRYTYQSENRSMTIEEPWE